MENMQNIANIYNNSNKNYCKEKSKNLAILIGGNGGEITKSENPRIYVNTKTRNKKPFFIHSCKAYDGSILAIFPKFEADSKTLQNLCDKLNSVDWAELGFVCDGRFLFSQRSLENCLLDERFKEHLCGLNAN